MKKPRALARPLELELLVHYHVMGVEHNRVETRNEQYMLGVQALLESGLIHPTKEGSGTRGYDASYVTTARGRAHVEAILNLPLPVAVWETPPR